MHWLACMSLPRAQSEIRGHHFWCFYFHGQQNSILSKTWGHKYNSIQTNSVASCLLPDRRNPLNYMTDMITVCLVTWLSSTCALHKYALQMSCRGWQRGLFVCWKTGQHFGKWRFHFTNSEHIFKPAVSSVLETRRLFERSEKAEPSDPLSSHPEPHRGICWPVLRHACCIVYTFLFQPCPNRSAWWRLECTVTYLRWLCGQIAGDVTHPDISEASLRLASAAAALPSSSLPTSRPSTAFTLKLWHTGT